MLYSVRHCFCIQIHLFFFVLIFFIFVSFCLVFFFFFFSSRRRHTRCGRDWSSDVCSSDLIYINFSGSLALRVGLPLTFTLLEVYLMGLFSITSITVSGPPEPQKKHSAKGNEERIICSGLNIPSNGII